MKKKLAILSISLIGFLSGCYNDNMEELFPADPLGKVECDTLKTVSYLTDIKPLMEKSCGTTNSCHGSTSGIVDFTQYNNLKGYADACTLMNVILWAPGAAQMPKNLGQRLDPCKRALFKSWVAAGAPNN
jgi:hypothetical protein